jgi:hypothetical protein
MQKEISSKGLHCQCGRTSASGRIDTAMAEINKKVDLNVAPRFLGAIKTPARARLIFSIKAQAVLRMPTSLDDPSGSGERRRKVNRSQRDISQRKLWPATVPLDTFAESLGISYSIALLDAMILGSVPQILPYHKAQLRVSP